MTELPEIKCDVCNNEPSVGVAAVPGVPISVAYGAKCLAADAHPYGIMVANTAMAGGDLGRTTGWWQEMVENTLRHLGKTREEFDADVAEVLEDFNADVADALEELEPDMREQGETDGA